MTTPLELFQSIEALGIILFSLVSSYYGIRILLIHYSLHRKLMACCWITLIQTITQILFLFAYIYIFGDLLLTGISITCPNSFGTIFIRPIVLLNNIIVAIYLKIRFIETKNKELKEDVKNG